MNRFYLIAAATLLVVSADAKTKFDYSVMMVPEEASMYFEKITDDADCVCSRDLVRFNARSWWAGPQIALSPDGSKIAYITDRNGMQNIMVKSSAKGGASTQRTSRVHVKDVTWSSDGRAASPLSRTATCTTWPTAPPASTAAAVPALWQAT